MHNIFDRLDRHLVLKNFQTSCQLPNNLVWKVAGCSITAELKYHRSALLFHNYVIITLLLTNPIAVIARPVL